MMLMRELGGRAVIPGVMRREIAADPAAHGMHSETGYNDWRTEPYGVRRHAVGWEMECRFAVTGILLRTFQRDEAAENPWSSL